MSEQPKHDSAGERYLNHQSRRRQVFHLWAGLAVVAAAAILSYRQPAPDMSDLSDVSLTRPRCLTLPHSTA